jgi:hypothetical protein
MAKARRLLGGAALAIAVSLAAPACASPYVLHRYPAGARPGDDRAYWVGFDEGRDHGEQDARRRRSYDYTRHRDFHDADDGYRGVGSRFEYRRLFQEGFIAGYDEGYRRRAPGAYGYPAPPGRPGGARPPSGYPGYPRAVSPAAQNGYQDGYDQGVRDARDRDRFDPVRAPRYRSGDRGYNSRYGSRDDYKREYRAAFQQGYAEGYRQYRR